MNIREIHEIIAQISETLNCPRCNTRILPNRIRVAEIRQNGDYLFDVDCQHCQAEMSLSAHVERVSTDTARQAPLYQKNRNIHKEEPPISALEVAAMKEALANFCGSFVQTFSV